MNFKNQRYKNERGKKEGSEQSSLPSKNKKMVVYNIF